MVKTLTLVVPIGMFLLSGCQTTGGSFCDLAKPIRLSPEQIDQLTDDQVRQYLGHNTRGQKLCGWRT